MRFYYLTLTLLLLNLNVTAQPADAVELSPNQIALIGAQGSNGIQKAFKELEIEIQDLPKVEAFALEVSLNQLSNTTTSKLAKKTASDLVVALAGIATSENVNASYVIEYVSAGIVSGIINLNQNSNIDMYEAIEVAAKGSLSGAVQFSIDTGANIDKVASAVGSGYLAGTIESSKDLGLDIIKAVKISSAGLINGSINATYSSSDIKIYETLSSTCEGIAEAAIEASVREQLDLIDQVTAASIGAAEAAVRSATALNLEMNLTQKAIYEGIKRGTKDSIPGKGNNIRIMITPIKDINYAQLIKSVKKGIYQGGFQADYFPIIETPYEDDPIVRTVSPI